MVTQLACTALTAWHAAHGGRMVDFAGWSMPVQYDSIVAEHMATRQHAALFDISHMGRLRFDGPGAPALLNHLVTRDVARLAPGKIGYALVVDEQGGILDDVLVYRLHDAAEGEYYLLVVNAGNREKIVDWIRQHFAVEPHVTWQDLTAPWAMLALQGPAAESLLAPLVECALGHLGYYEAQETRIVGAGGIVSRTGYTGEDGFEIILGAGAALEVWTRLVQAGAKPAGLGCRDTLRLEAGMPLYGHELTQSIDPFQAGLGAFVHLTKGDFIGRAALAARRNQLPAMVRVGLELEGKRVPREGYAVLAQQRVVGQVTSGTYSPTCDRPVAMAYVERDLSAVGTQLQIDLRGRPATAQVVALPFYRRPTKKESV